EADTVAAARSALHATGARLGEAIWLNPGIAAEVPFAGGTADGLEQGMAEALERAPVDWAVLPLAGRRKKLFIADMDSTIITVECIDEIADFAGIKARVAEITEAAMRGDLDFVGALRERVSLLKGLDEA